MRLTWISLCTFTLAITACAPALDIQYQQFNFEGSGVYPSSISFEYPTDFTQTSKRSMCNAKNTCIQFQIEGPSINNQPLKEWYEFRYGQKIKAKPIQIAGKDGLKAIGKSYKGGFESLPLEEIFTARLFIPIQEKMLVLHIINHEANADDKAIQRYVKEVANHIAETIVIK